MTITEVIPQISDPALDDEDPIFSHYIERDEKETAGARVLRASVEGTPLVAICGYTWVPSRNPENHPVCPKCMELVDMAKDLRH